MVHIVPGSIPTGEICGLAVNSSNVVHKVVPCRVGSMKWVVCTSLANSVLRTSLTQELA